MYFSCKKKSLEDNQIITGCKEGNKICQKALWDKYSKKLFAVSSRYLQNSEDAEDSLIESFVKIYNSIGKFRGESSIETWMRRIVVNQSINKIRARKSVYETDVEGINPVPFDDSQFENMDVQQILKLVQELPDGFRTVFNMYAIDGYSHKEIADSLGIQEGTSRSQFAKARMSLAKSLNKLASFQKINENDIRID